MIAALLAGLVVGERGAVSAALGGAACIVPNALFALRLSLAGGKPGASQVASFFIGELVKVVATIGLLAAIWLRWQDVHALSLLAGLVLALKANLLALLIRH